MIPVIPIICLAYFILYALAAQPQQHLAIPYSNDLRPIQSEFGAHNSLEAWIFHQEGIAWRRLLDNVAPTGKNIDGDDSTLPGVVIASPSRANPNYYFHWVRDAAITTSHIAHLYAKHPASPFSRTTLLPFLSSAVDLTHRLQRTRTPSGPALPFSLLSLGEPKFHPNATPFLDPWGRPQHDGPALRALSLIAYLRAWNASDPELWASRQANLAQRGDDAHTEDPFALLYEASMPPLSTIKADLEYVSSFWNDSAGFDLWEERRGRHLFSGMMQARALREGADVAARFGDEGARAWYELQADKLEGWLLGGSFWDDERGHLVSTAGRDGRSGLDCAALLGSTLGTAAAGEGREDAHGGGESIFPPQSDEVLVTLMRLAEDAAERYPINRNPASGRYHREERAQPLRPAALGRYPEDTYDGYGSDPARGGNPWFLCTCAAAEVLYRAAAHFNATSSSSSPSAGGRPIPLTARSRPFWRAILPSLDVNLGLSELKSGSTPHAHAIHALVSLGDGFLGVVRRHVDAEGGMSEQLDRETGFLRGARDLGWSYGGFIGAVRARRLVLGG